MADTTTSALGLTKPAFDDPAGANTWGNKLNADMDIIDARTGGKSTIAVGDVDVNLVANQLAYNLVLAGSSGADVTVYLPPNQNGTFSVLNGITTTHSVSIGIQGAVGGKVVIPQGARYLLIAEGTDIVRADSGSVPAGSLFAFTGQVAPAGFILPVGQVLARADFPALFAVIGTLYNVGGEAAANFRCPDLRGKTVAALDNMGGVGANVLTIAGASFGASVGEQNHTLVGGELAPHTHPVTDPGHVHAVNDPGHFHIYNKDNAVNVAAVGTSASVDAPTTPSPTQNTVSSLTGITLGNVTTGVTVAANTGAGQPHNNVQPTLVCYYILKV